MFSLSQNLTNPKHWGTLSFVSRHVFSKFLYECSMFSEYLEIICWPTDMKSGKEGFVILSRLKD